MTVAQVEFTLLFDQLDGAERLGGGLQQVGFQLGLGQEQWLGRCDFGVVHRQRTLGIDQRQRPGTADRLAAVLIVLDERLADAVRFLCLLLGHGAGKEILTQVADAPEGLGILLTVVADRRQVGQTDGKSICHGSRARCALAE